MKKSRLSYDEWKCIIAKRSRGKQVSSELISGYIGLIEIQKVSEAQIWNFNGEKITVCDEGVQWLSILPRNDYYCITAMMDEKGKILLWYIDMIADQGIDGDGVPYFEDLYLDLVVYPDGTIVVDDVDELEDALRKMDITHEQYELAIDTCSKLQKGMLNNMEAFILYTQKCYELVV